MRGRGSNPKSRYNLRTGGNAKVYWVYEAGPDGNKKLEGPYSFTKAYWVATAKNGSEKTNKYFADK